MTDIGVKKANFGEKKSKRTEWPRNQRSKSTQRHVLLASEAHIFVLLALRSAVS